MRFGIPDGFDSDVMAPRLPVSRPKTDHFRPSLVPIPLFAHLDAFREATALTEAEIQLKASQNKEARERYRDAEFERRKRSVAQDISHITGHFERLLIQQQRDAKEVIRRYNDAKEKALLEKKRREEEKAAIRAAEEQRRRDEELKRQQQEEERKRQEKLRKEREDAAAKLKAEEERKRKEDEQKRQEEERKKAESKRAHGVTNFRSVEAEFITYKTHIEEIKNTVVTPVNSNAELKKAVGALKRKINPKFGQLTNSFAQLNIVATEVIALVASAKPNEMAFKWILNFIAKAVVAQAETEVTVKPTAALPLARLADRLLDEIPEFEYFLTARFVKKCPFIIGYTCAIDSEEGRRRMGWKRSQSKWEDEVKYEERVAGICSVWAVITRLKPAAQQKHTRYSINAAWSFLARLLNTQAEVLSNVHFVIASNWWEACSEPFLSAFGRQAMKLLRLLVEGATVAVKGRKFPASTRLALLGEEWMQIGNMNQLKEMER